MAFGATKVGETVFGNKRFTWGYWTAGGDTGGDIDTGLTKCESIMLVAAGSSIVADAPTVNEAATLSAGKPIAGSAVTIITTSNTSGLWWAFGY